VNRNTILQLSIPFTDTIPSNHPPAKCYLFIISRFIDYVTIWFMLMQKLFDDVEHIVIEVVARIRSAVSQQ